MKRAVQFVAAACLVLTFTGFAALAADDAKWEVRLRALNLRPADNSDPIPALEVPADQITVNKKTFPEVDISYFFTKNVAAELVLTYPQSQDVSVKGLGKIGSFKHLPPTLSVQYHFLPDGVFQPYVGVGVNYTIISDVDLAIDLGEGGILRPDLEKSSLGWSVGAGFDVKVADKWFANFDVKKVKIGADVTLDGAKISHVDVDPLLISVGVGYRF